MPSFAEVKVLQQQNILNVHHMHTWVCTVFKWNYEQHLYTHTLIPIINRLASTNEPLNIVKHRKQELIEIRDNSSFMNEFMSFAIDVKWKKVRGIKTIPMKLTLNIIAMVILHSYLLLFLLKLINHKFIILIPLV